METLQEGVYTKESTIPVIDDLAQEEYSQYVPGKFLRIIAGVVLITYALVTFNKDVTEGYYAYKIPVMLAASLLLFSPPSYPYLLGFIIPIHYVLKSHQYALPEYNYMAEFTSVMVILMAFFSVFLKSFSEDQRNPYQKFDLGTFCLLGIIAFSLLGVIVIGNRFLYFRRMVQISAFCCAFYLGRSCLNVRQSLKLLLIGLALGILTFQLSITVGFVMREGVNILRNLHRYRSMMVSSGTDSGALLVMFVIAYSLSIGGVSKRYRRFALWLVAVPAATVIMLYLSRSAVLLLPVTVFLSLMFSGRRGAALVVAFASVLIAVVAYTQVQAVQDLFSSFIERMLDISAGATLRGEIRLEGIKYGLSNPLWGIGAGQYLIHSGFFLNAHNEIVNIFAEHGVVALILYCVFWFYLLRMAMKLRLSKNALMQTLAGMYLVLLPVYFVYIQRGPMYYKRGGLLFAFCIGILVTLYYRHREEREI